MATICSIPVEVSQHILSYCHPRDVAAFSKTCRAAYAVIYLANDQHLWRLLFLNTFDPPNIAKVDWKGQLTTRMKVELGLFHGPITLEERNTSLRVILQVIKDSTAAVFRRGSSNSLMWLRRILRDSLLLNNIYTATEAGGEYALLYSQFRSHVAFTISLKDKHTSELMLNTRDSSRAFVYDLRNYKAENMWGPFLPDGAVNWVHIEHIINVVALNIRELPGSWALTRPPTCIDSPRVSSLPVEERRAPEDWAGVEGTWRRYVCFMDYRDLFSFNFSDIPGGSRNARFFQDPRFREATRLIEVKLHIIPTEQIRFHNHFDLHAREGNPYPPLCFAGSSKGVNGNEATVEGFVTMGIDGSPRWHFAIQTSVYDGHPQWSSIGVQIGGIGSAMGVVGIWSTTHHDPDDPAGPFWLWKVEDGSPPHLMEYT